MVVAAKAPHGHSKNCSEGEDEGRQQTVVAAEVYRTGTTKKKTSSKDEGENRQKWVLQRRPRTDTAKIAAKAKADKNSCGRKKY